MSNKDITALVSALELIDRHGCTNNTSGRCWDDGARTRGAKYGADAWCDACVARDALNTLAGGGGVEPHHDETGRELAVATAPAAVSDVAPVVWRIKAVPEGAEPAMIGQRYRLDGGRWLWWNHNTWDPSMFSGLGQMAAAGYRLVEDTEVPAAVAGERR